MENAGTTLTAEQEQLFKETVEMTLYLWDALSIAINHDARGSQPGVVAELRANLRDAVLDEFKGISKTLPPTSTLVDNLEELLAEFMDAVFEVVIDDDSLAPTAVALARRYGCVARGEPGDLDDLRRRYHLKLERGGDGSVRATRRDDVDQDTDGSDSDSDDGSDDNGMKGVVLQQQQQQQPKKEKPAPEVDEDGFTTVSRRR